MAVWSTCAGFERGPRPKNMTSPGSRSSMPTRLARGTSPFISIVVRPRSTSARLPSPGYAVSLYTRQTKPEQSKATESSSVPQNAVAMIRRCHGVSPGSWKAGDAAFTCSTSQLEA
jgi:hypothetical protein